jgi:hypothetical protein
MDKTYLYKIPIELRAQLLLQHDADCESIKELRELYTPMCVRYAVASWSILPINVLNYIPDELTYDLLFWRSLSNDPDTLAVYYRDSALLNDITELLIYIDTYYSHSQRLRLTRSFLYAPKCLQHYIDNVGITKENLNLLLPHIDLSRSTEVCKILLKHELISVNVLADIVINVYNGHSGTMCSTETLVKKFLEIVSPFSDMKSLLEYILSKLYVKQIDSFISLPIVYEYISIYNLLMMTLKYNQSTAIPQLAKKLLEQSLERSFGDDNMVNLLESAINKGNLGCLRVLLTDVQCIKYCNIRLLLCCLKSKMSYHAIYEIFTMIIRHIDIELLTAAILDELLRLSISINHDMIVQLLLCNETKYKITVTEELLLLAIDSKYSEIVELLIERSNSRTIYILDKILSRYISPRISNKVVIEIPNEHFLQVDDVLLSSVLLNSVYYYQPYVLSYLLSYKRVRDLIIDSNILTKISKDEKYDISAILIIKHCFQPDPILNSEQVINMKSKLMTVLDTATECKNEKLVQYIKGLPYWI